MKLRHLESCLEDVGRFKEPKVVYEQYVTSPHIAACIIHTAHTRYNDIHEKTIADLGSGCGILSIASMLLGANFCYAIDIDKDALQIAKDNCEKLELQDIEFVQADVKDLLQLSRSLHGSIDTIVMNPPFGTKNNCGMDMAFLEAASKIANKTIYSLHKSTTRKHVLRKAREFKLKGEVIAELRYDLPATYKFHQKKTKDIEVDFIRFSVDI